MILPDFIIAVRWQDVVDILLNSYILFRLHILFRGTNTFRVLIGIAFLWFFSGSPYPWDLSLRAGPFKALQRLRLSSLSSFFEMRYGPFFRHKTGRRFSGGCRNKRFSPNPTRFHQPFSHWPIKISVPFWCFPAKKISLN